MVGLGLLGLSAGGAAAQFVSACVQQCEANGWSMAQCTRYCETTRPGEARASGARVYGYQGTYQRGGSCGQFRYLKGGECVDARTDPPRLD